MCITEDNIQSERIKMRELEAVSEMAILFHKRLFQKMTTAYQALGAWIASNNYEMNGPTRAIYQKRPWCEDDPANYLTVIQALVIKIKY